MNRFDERIAEILACTGADRETIEAASARVRDLVRRGIPTPFVYMGSDGGFSIEWSLPGHWEVSVDFERNSIEGDTTNTRTGATSDFVLLPTVSDDELAAAVSSLLDFTGTTS